MVSLRRKLKVKNIKEKEFNKILIIRLSGMGDVIYTLPLLSALRSKYGSKHIAWLVSSKAKDVVAGHPLIDEVIVFEREKGIVGAIKAIKELRKRKYDLVLDPQSQLRSGLFAFLGAIPVRMGFARGVSKEPGFIFMNERVSPLGNERHNVDRDLGFARHLGIERGRVEFNLKIETADSKFADSYLAESCVKKNEKLVGFSIACSMQNRKWSNKNWAQLNNEIALKENIRTVILWGPGEEQDMKAIISLSKERALSAPKTNIKQLAAIIKKCSLIIGNDSGPLHLAVALGIPVIGLCGPTDPEITGPYGNGNISIRKNLTVLPCYVSEKNSSRCKKFRSCLEKTCIELITVKDVVSAFKRITNEYGG